MLCQYSKVSTAIEPLRAAIMTEMTDLKVLISTLPVKGEESLDLQPSDTASPNLDNFISSSLSGGDQARGFLG